MRSERRKRKNNEDDIQDKLINYAIIGIVVLLVILVGVFLYSKNLSDSIEEGTIDLEEMANQNSENKENVLESESVSTDLGKSIQEAENELNNTNSTNTKNDTNSTNTSNATSTNKTNNKSTNNTTKSVSSAKNEDSAKETTELTFEKPVEGDIIKEYAKDNLVYSNTLQEWTTHLGIDIKADKTSVVKAAQKGTVKTIKNDPRYGLTIAIEHEDGFQTVYSNLLSSEFVVEGESVEKGQSIGTVGNTAPFEISDEAHLHFAILKDSVEVDPNIYLK